MGFMDKAKQLAEQAQQKLDETQKNINKSSSPDVGTQGEAVKHDEHGRPIQEAPPAAAAPPPSAEPTAPVAPAAEPTKEQPAADAPTPPPAPSGGDSNATPDPFKPIQ